MAELVHYAVDSGVATITLDSPHNRNALSRQLVAELGAWVQQAIATPSVKVAVITATGTVFCSGADLKERADDGAATTAAAFKGGLPDIMQLIMESDLPFVAALNGSVRAGGTGIVASCDIAVGPRSATFALPEVHIGVIPALISIPLSRVVDRRGLMRYAMSGEQFAGDEAVRIGLLTAVADTLDEALAPILAGLKRAHPAALRRTKRLFNEMPALPLTTAFALAGEVSAGWFASSDAQEGIRAIFEKRLPSWL